MGKKRYCWWKTFKFSGLVGIAMLAVPRQRSPWSCSRIFSFPCEVISSAASLQTVWLQPGSTGSPTKTKKSLAHGAGATTSVLLPLPSRTLIAHCMGDWKRQTSKGNPTQLPPHREDLSLSFCLLPPNTTYSFVPTSLLILQKEGVKKIYTLGDQNSELFEQW